MSTQSDNQRIGSVSFASNMASFLLGSLVTVVAGYLYTATIKKQDKNELGIKQTQFITEEIRSEQLSRNTLFFGEDGMKRISDAAVVVVGLGGVGSHTAHMLARSGVGHLRLIDFDQVTLSSLNRHAVATLNDVGIPKVVAMKRFLEKICPDNKLLHIDARAQMYTGDILKDGDLMESPFGKPWDFVVDAIDDVTTKALLLEHCIRHGIRVISCMGAGGKCDPSRLHVSDLRAATSDPLATKIRVTLKRIFKDAADQFLDDMDKLAVVYSSEKAVVKLAEFTEEQKRQGVHNFGAVDNMRIRVLPVLGTMPAIMGQTQAAFVLCQLGGKPFSPLIAERVGRSVRYRLHQHLKNRESAIRQNIESAFPGHVHNTEDDDKQEPRIIGGHWVGPVQIDADDVEYILSEVWRNRCAVYRDSLGSPLELVRWDKSKASDCQNLVVLTSKARKMFDQYAIETGDGRNSVAPEIRTIIEARLATCRIDPQSYVRS